MISAIMESHQPKMIAGKHWDTKKNINDKEPYTHGYKIIRKVVGCATVFVISRAGTMPEEAFIKDWKNTSKDKKFNSLNTKNKTTQYKSDNWYSSRTKTKETNCNC